MYFGSHIANSGNHCCCPESRSKPPVCDAVLFQQGAVELSFDVGYDAARQQLFHVLRNWARLQRLVSDCSDDSGRSGQFDPRLERYAVFVKRFALVGDGIMDVHGGAIRLELTNDVDYAGVAQIRTVLLERQTENDNGCVL